MEHSELIAHSLHTKTQLTMEIEMYFVNQKDTIIQVDTSNY